MAHLTLVTHPHSQLHKPSATIQLKEIATYQNLIQDMIETMYQNHGIGLAAPQIGKWIRIVIISTDHGALPLINPEIIKSSSHAYEDEEGCLSVPGVYGKVIRAKRVTVKAINPEGKPIKMNAAGLLARVIQHEVDHINGILILDRFSKSSATSSKKISGEIME